jgi:uncharacterized membrane-anchored protein YitT (DUF2179 family)
MFLFYVVTLTNSLLSMTRYLVINVPLFIIAAIVMSKSKILAALALSISVSLLFLYSAMFGQWYWVG